MWNRKKRAVKEENKRGDRKKDTYRCSICIINSITREIVKDEKIDGAKNADKEA